MIHGFFFFKQKTAYEMRISDWSSDVCSSDLRRGGRRRSRPRRAQHLPHSRESGGTGLFRHRPASPRGRRSEERRVGKSVSVRVDLGGRRILKKKNPNTNKTT